MSADRLLPMWACAIDSGYALPDVWQRWADELVLAMEQPLNWIMEMSLKTSRED